MSATTTTEATWPPVDAQVQDDGSGWVRISDQVTPIAAESVESARAAVLEHVKALAAELSRAVYVTTRDPSGAWPLWVQADGSVSPADDPAPRRSPAPLADAATDPEWEAIAAEPARDGARGRFNRLLGTRIAPGAPERDRRREEYDDERSRAEARRTAERQRQAEQTDRETRRAAREREAAQRTADERALIQTNLQGSRTVLVANPKGGARKTTSTYLLAATLGIIRGGSVVAWDANETMGTLGERAQPDLHARTVVDLLHEAAEAFGTLDSSRVGNLDRYVRPQGDSHFDVLASDEDPTRQDVVDADGFRTVHDVLSRFYRMVLVDTGNNIRADHFQAGLDAADQLVIPVAAGRDSARVAQHMIRSFRAAGHGALVDSAVVLIHDLEPRNDDAAYFETAQQIAREFEDECAAVVAVPFDAALKDGDRIDYADTAEPTRLAYRKAATALARSLRETVTEAAA